MSMNSSAEGPPYSALSPSEPIHISHRTCLISFGTLAFPGPLWSLNKICVKHSKQDSQSREHKQKSTHEGLSTLALSSSNAGSACMTSGRERLRDQESDCFRLQASISSLFELGQVLLQRSVLLVEPLSELAPRCIQTLSISAPVLIH